MKKQKARENRGGLFYYQKKPGQTTGDMIRELQENGTIPKDKQVLHYSNSVEFMADMTRRCTNIPNLPNTTEKDKLYTAYVDRRVIELQVTQGTQHAYAFAIASFYFAEYENVYSGLKLLLKKAGLEEMIDAYLKSMTFYIFASDRNQTDKPKIVRLTDIKTLLFYVGGTFLSRISSSINCPLMKKDYDIVLDMSIPGFFIIFLNECAELLKNTKTSLKIISSLDGSMPDLYSNSLGNAEITEMTMQDFVSVNKANPDFTYLSDYFDELLDYAITNDLFNDYRNYK
jgi:hypothetical protein